MAEIRDELFYKQKNGYDTMSTQQRIDMEDYCRGYMAFLNEARTEREAVKIAIEMAEDKGFVEYVDGMKLSPGDKVYCNNRSKALMLAVIGKKSLEEGCVIAGAHVDSPRIDLKQNPLYESDELAYFKTHYYGGIKKYQWVTIPLELHGVVALKNGETIDVSIGHDPSDPQFVITDLLPHLGKEQMRKTMEEGITGEGLNILTGETGAGKSILIGSINAALGKKISREMIRTGETSALVELVFETENPHVLELLKEMDLEAEEGQVIISRKITGSRSVCRINGEACNISQVKARASLLLDIHGQHEHQSLLYPDRQIAILDAFAGTEAATAKGEVRALYQEWKNVRKELSAYELDEEARKREAAFLTFEINEIDQAELKEGEDEALETAYRKMGHAKKIAESLQTVYAITGYGAENSAGEQVGRAIRELQQAAVYDDALSGPSQTLSDIDGLLNDFNREISAYLSELTFSEEEYYETEKRLDEINRLKAKYGKTMEEIAAYREEQQKKLEKLENFESCRAALQEQLQKTEQKLDAAAHNLSKIRRNYAKRLETQIIEGLRDLNFLHVAFEISFEKTKSYTENGTDAVEFLISTNPGEAIRPLAKVVSGGELSRIMLAIKTILADRDETETLIFDEIDTGISGRTAQKVSEKMAQIGQRHQVICITHLPQIAAMADSHFEIEKNVEENEAVTSIHPLSEEDSVRELARMLGGAKITDSVLANASEMKELAQVQKSARLK